MSVYSLTTASEKAIGMLLTAGGGSETLLLRRPANELRAELHLEAAGRTLTAVIMLGHQRNTLTLQDGDGANQLNLADYIESIANGTAGTAEASEAPQFTIPAAVLAEHMTTTVCPPVPELAPCAQCGSEAIAFDYADPEQKEPGPTRFINGVKCRHGDCLCTRGHANAQVAAIHWNRIQAQGPVVKQGLTTADHNLLLVTCQKGGHASLAMGATITVHAHDLNKRTAITVRGDQSSIHSGSVRDVISALRESLAA